MLASVCSGVSLSAFAESFPLEAREACAAVEEVPSLLLEEKVSPKATDEGESIPAVEDVPSLPFEANGAPEDVLRETSPALRAPSPEGRAEAVESLS
ncbi:MAG: hypothetical protein IKA78_02160, partial [Oscillospiraceae bacterium]|nr:hypothetical protein [Oscillospiraceae bacterium]